MRRRTFIAVVLFIGWSQSTLAATNKKFAFKIKTKDRSIMSNVLIQAHDEDAAKVKLIQRYPGCMVLRVDVK